MHTYFTTTLAYAYYPTGAEAVLDRGGVLYYRLTEETWVWIISRVCEARRRARTGQIGAKVIEEIETRLIALQEAHRRSEDFFSLTATMLDGCPLRAAIPAAGTAADAGIVPACATGAAVGTVAGEVAVAGAVVAVCTSACPAAATVRPTLPPAPRTWTPAEDAAINACIDAHPCEFSTDETCDPVVLLTWPGGGPLMAMPKSMVDAWADESAAARASAKKVSGKKKSSQVKKQEIVAKSLPFDDDGSAEAF